MLRKSYVLIALVLFSATAAAAPELRGSPQELEQYLQSETRTVSIRQTATENAYTDRARVSLTVTTEHKSLAEAIRLNRSLRLRTIQEFSAAGISSDDIRASKFSTSPQYGWFGKAPSSFEVINTIVVVVESEEQFQAVAAVADRQKEIQVSQTEFEHSQKDEFEKKVRQKAMDKVMEERQFYETQLGLSLRPVSFSVSTARPQPMRRRAQVESLALSDMEGGMAMDQAMQTGTFDEIRYMSSVQVLFEVETTHRSGGD